MNDSASTEPETLARPGNWWAHKDSPGRLLCRIETTSGDDYRVIIEQADPRIWIGTEMVSWAATGQAAPRITLKHRPNWSEDGYWIGSVIRFHADNRDVLYRLTSWRGEILALDPESNNWDLGYFVAEWPD